MAVAEAEIEVAPGQSIEELALNVIVPAPDNPRRELGDVTELAASMSELGLLQPIVVTPRGGKFMIVCGHRRHAAAKVAKLGRVPALVRELNEQQRVKAMLIENCQREGLGPLEEARAYKTLTDLGLTQRQIATDVGKSQGHISKRLALLEIPKPAAAALDSGGITLEDALELAKLSDDPKRAERAWKQRGQTYGGIARAVKDELAAKERDKRLAALEEKLAARGARTIRFKANQYGSLELPSNAVEIRKGGGYDVLNIDPSTHASEPCHAIALKTDRWSSDVEEVPVCTDRKRHPKAKTGDESYRGRQRETSQQREHRELGKLRGPRRAFAATVARSRLPKNEHAKLILDTLIASAHAEVLKGACLMLLPERPTGNGYRDFGAALREYASSPATQIDVEAAIAFATHEEFLGAWNDWDQHAPYLELLEQHGYELAPLEAKRIGRKSTGKAAA